MERQSITLTTSHAEGRFGGSLRLAVWTKHCNQQLPISKSKSPCLVSSQQPSQGQLAPRTHPFLFCRELFLFCRELFGFAVNFFSFAASLLVLPRAVLFLPWPFCFAASCLVLPWAFWFCRELFGFAVSCLVLPRAVWFCRELFCFAVNVFGFAVNSLKLWW